MARVRIIGGGRAGGSFAGALLDVGWDVDVCGREDDVTGAAGGVDLVLLAVPDAAVGPVAGAVAPGEAVVAHVSGSLGLAPLAAHARRAVLHPLVSLPDPKRGAARLRDGAWFGVATAGDPVARQIVDQLGGRLVGVAEDDWVRYHAAAAIASNHLVGLLGQVERVASSIGVPLEAYLALAEGSMENVGALGAAAALTGPVRRGDWATVERHLEALPEEERDAYRAGVELCRRLLG